ncbi:hypothetical protein KAI04_04905 [Candidatus Pacearchaeota archaeon]|nr:hypothetical protein [Candidatus Pacearchaeota archaeon]
MTFNIFKNKKEKYNPIFKIGDHVVLIKNEEYAYSNPMYIYEVTKVNIETIYVHGILVNINYINIKNCCGGGEHCGLDADKFRLIRRKKCYKK